MWTIRYNVHWSDNHCTHSISVYVLLSICALIVRAHIGYRSFEMEQNRWHNTFTRMKRKKRKREWQKFNKNNHCQCRALSRVDKLIHCLFVFHVIDSLAFMYSYWREIKVTMIDDDPIDFIRDKDRSNFMFYGYIKTPNAVINLSWGSIWRRTIRKEKTAVVVLQW